MRLEIEELMRMLKEADERVLFEFRGDGTLVYVVRGLNRKTAHVGILHPDPPGGDNLTWASHDFEHPAEAAMFIIEKLNPKIYRPLIWRVAQAVYAASLRAMDRSDGFTPGVAEMFKTIGQLNLTDREVKENTRFLREEVALFQEAMEPVPTDAHGAISLLSRIRMVG